MGHGESKLLSEEKELSKDYMIDSQIKEENLTFLTSRKTQQKYLLREMVFATEPEYQDMLRRLQQRRPPCSPFITKLQRLEFFKEQNLCSNYFRIYSLWEYPKRTLADQIKDRALYKKPFKQEELKQLLLQIAQVLSACEDNKRSHQCLTTRSLLLEENGSLKVLDVLAMQAHPNLQVVYHKRSTKNTYLSPAHCAILAKNQFDQSACHPFQEDIFITAMIILQCALLERQDNCYEPNWEGVQWERLADKLRVFEGRYGKQLKILLEQMLEKDSQKRIHWKNIIDSLNLRQYLRHSDLKSAIVTQSIIRESRGLPLQRIPPAPVIVTESPIITNPRSSFVFTYNSKQAQRNSITNPISVGPTISRTSYEQGPVIRMIQPPLHKFIVTIPPPSHPLSVIKRTAVDQQIHIQPSMSSKFTPIALTEVKRKTETVPTGGNPSQNGVAGSGNKNEFKINSPTVLQVQPLRPDVKNFSFHIADPIFTIDQYGQGKRYQGYKVNGKKQGEGKFYLDNKLCFDGHWKEDLMEGQGKLYYQSGSLAYDGTFYKDRFHGFGKLYNESPEILNQSYNYQNFQDIEQYWISYEGYFENDLKEGHGELYLTNGQHFEGNFHIDFVDGEGVFTTNEGKQIRGLWKENKLQRRLN